MENKKFDVKHFVLLPIVLIVTVLLWCMPAECFGIDGLTVTMQRTIAIFAFAALMWIFEIVPNWVTSLIVIVGSLLTISNKSISVCITPNDYLQAKEIALLDSAKTTCARLGVCKNAIAAIDSAKTLTEGARLGDAGKGDAISKENLHALRRQYTAIMNEKAAQQSIADTCSSTAEARVHLNTAKLLGDAAATLFNKDTEKATSMTKTTTYEQGKLVPFKTLMGAFADPVVMLFLGGFVLAIVAAKYGMDVQLARILLMPFGKNPKFVLLGVLLVISIFSMFMSNTATAAMFLAFLAPVFGALPESDKKGKIGIVLAIPIAANIGGIGTPIGTPPNATAVGILENNGMAVTFGEWAVRMIPFVVIMILLAWIILMILYPFKSKEIKLEIKKDAHKKTWRDHVAWITFGVTILLWMTEEIHHVSSNVVALIPLAVYTATGVFTKEDIKEINWSVLWLVAGGFALGYALNDTGLAKAMVNSIDFGSMNIIVVFAVAGLICYFLSNFISNSATAALLIPIMVAMGKGLMESTNANSFIAWGGQHALAIFVAVCASLAMLLPISTPPNAIASSTGLVETKDMTKVGLIIGIVGLVLGFFWVTKFFPFA